MEKVIKLTQISDKPVNCGEQKTNTKILNSQLSDTEYRCRQIEHNTTHDMTRMQHTEHTRKLLFEWKANIHDNNDKTHKIQAWNLLHTCHMLHK